MTQTNVGDCDLVVVTIVDESDVKVVVIITSLVSSSASVGCMKRKTNKMNMQMTFNGELLDNIIGFDVCFD